MKDELPAPEFDGNQYERPTQKWICGHAADGHPCRVGPDGHGNCRATFECSPVLELKEGESKGRYRCTRPKEFGGPCQLGPLPDGTCSRAIPKCVPVRSLRAKRGVIAWATVAGTVALLLVGLAGPRGLRLINPGPLSDQHSTEAFAKMHGKGTNEMSACATCHTTAETGTSGWLASAFGSNPGPFDWQNLAGTGPPEMNSIDQACQKCHPGRAFHEPNVVREHSCSACHQEHKGTLALHQPLDRNCASCHADTPAMELSYQKGKTLTASAFDFRPNLGRLLFKAPRPERGYTKVFRSFADHPEFQVVAERLQESNTLRFNHQRHFSEDIPPLNGKKLECAFCHRPDASGQFHLKIAYESNCKSCHSLQFDAANPQLALPHGNAEAVRAFLRSLPSQYADYGAREKRITGKRELESFAREQLAQIREQMVSIEELEQKIFFSGKRWAPGGRIGTLPEGNKPLFYGCAYCHDVKASRNGMPSITSAAIPDRWFVRGSFNHAKHSHISCAQCHDATRSRDTSDILLPSKAACTTCHSPEGGVAHSCSTCHSYHIPRGETLGTKLPEAAAR